MKKNLDREEECNKLQAGTDRFQLDRFFREVADRDAARDKEDEAERRCPEQGPGEIFEKFHDDNLRNSGRRIQKNILLRIMFLVLLTSCFLLLTSYYILLSLLLHHAFPDFSPQLRDTRPAFGRPSVQR